MDKLIFGCGYLGLRVARRWRDTGDKVCVVTRSRQRAETFRAEGFVPIIADVTNPATLLDLPNARSVLYAVGFDQTCGHSVEQMYVDGIKSVLDAMPSSVKRFLHISSTGVYGQCDGSWVDEESVCEPARPSARACFDAEKAIAAHGVGDRSVILRLAGIYGPGRIPRQTEVQNGLFIKASAHGYLNLIHVDDAVTVILAAEERVVASRLYTVSDGHPVLRREYLRELAKLIGAPEPRFRVSDPDSPAARRAGSDKRVRNTRMLSELKVSLAYPSYREGLAAILAGGGGAR